MPFLDEQEWQQIEPLLPLAKQELIDYRIAHNCDLTTAKRNCYSQATQIFELMTGLPGFHFDVIYHHRLCDWGEECPSCGHLLRTPKASFCANCGWRPESKP